MRIEGVSERARVSQFKVFHPFAAGQNTCSQHSMHVGQRRGSNSPLQRQDYLFDVVEVFVFIATAQPFLVAAALVA